MEQGDKQSRLLEHQEDIRRALERLATIRPALTKRALGIGFHTYTPTPQPGVSPGADVYSRAQEGVIPKEAIKGG